MIWVEVVVVVLHVIGACIWTGGHLVLAFGILPRALARRSPEMILGFETVFERIGMPALGVQVATGSWLLYQAVLEQPEGSMLTHVTGLTIAKVTLLILTGALAVHAKFRLLPRLTADTMGALAWHIRLVTLLSVLFVIAGVGFRFGPQG